MSGIKHAKVSAKADDADASEINPSDWNADHTITGDVPFNAHKATGLADPTLAQDAATKNYVDTHSGGSGTITGVTAGTGLTGGGSSGSVTVALADTAVSPAAYTNANITVDQQGRITAAASGSAGSGTLVDMLLQQTGPLTMAAGLTSNWNAFSGTITSAVIVTPDPAGSQIDGILADGSGANGAIRIIIHSANNHGVLTFLNDEGSASTAANRIRTHSDGNISGAGVSMGHRDMAIAVYNSNIARWQLSILSSGAIKKLSLYGPLTDVALANGTVNNYTPTGIQYTSALRLASLGTTTLTGILGQSEGDTLWIHNYGSTNLTLTHNDAGSSAGNKFLLPNSSSLVIRPFGGAILRYDGTNGAWLCVAAAL